MKGNDRARRRSPQPAPSNDGTDNIVGRYTIFDLEGIDNSQPVRRYTVAELAQRLLILAIFETNSGVPSAICIECLKMALGESSCPHGHFPEDPRQAPKLVFPDQGRSGARSGTGSPNEALLATPLGPSRARARSHAASHRSGVAAPVSPNPERPTGSSTVNWVPCAFSHRHSSSNSALRCNDVAMLQTYEYPPPAPVTVATERSMQIAIAMSGEARDDEDTWSTISRTSVDWPSASALPPASTSTARQSSVTTSTAQPPAIRTSASSSAGVTQTGLARRESRGTNTNIQTAARHGRHQPSVEEDDSFVPQHPLVPIPPGANPIPAHLIHIDNDNPAITSWYIVTTGSIVGVFNNLTMAQRAAQVSRGSWRRVSSRQAALDEFCRAVEQNTVVVRP